jgi:hypothetical protein
VKAMGDDAFAILQQNFWAGGKEKVLNSIQKANLLFY